MECGSPYELKLYEKFGGCLDKKGIIACIALLLLAVPLANRLTWTGTAFYALKDYGWTLGECFLDLNYIIESSDLQHQFRADLMLGYFFTLLGSVFSFVRAFRSASGKPIFSIPLSLFVKYLSSIFFSSSSDNS